MGGSLDDILMRQGDKIMRRLNKFLSMVALGAMTVAAGSAMAATADGTLGATSTGTADVTLSINEQFQISDMNAFAFGAYGGTGDFDANDDICVYHNGDGSYRVTITDNSANVTANAFQVEDATDTNEIDMSIFWNDVTGVTGESAVTYNTALTPQSGANTSAADCSVGGLSANLHVVLAEADLQAATAGSYDSELTVLIEPD